MRRTAIRMTDRQRRAMFARLQEKGERRQRRKDLVVAAGAAAGLGVLKAWHHPMVGGFGRDLGKIWLLGKSINKARQAVQAIATRVKSTSLRRVVMRKSTKPVEGGVYLTKRWLRKGRIIFPEEVVFKTRKLL